MLLDRFVQIPDDIDEVMKNDEKLEILI